MNLPEQAVGEKASATPGGLMKLMVRSHSPDHTFFDEPHFRRMLRVERMRTERSKSLFHLILFMTPKAVLDGSGAL